MKKIFLLLTLFSALFLSACKRQDNDGQPVPDQPQLSTPSRDFESEDTSSGQTPDSSELSGSPSVPEELSLSKEQYDSAPQGINAIGYDLFAIMSSDSENICISPYSIEQALGMAANGAFGATLDEMLKTMHIKDINAFNRDIAASRQKLENDAMEIHIANSAWYSQTADFNESFEASYLPLLKDSYNADSFKSNFTDPNTPAAINDWIARATNDKITHMVTEIPQDTILILLNTVYFNAQWQTPFPKEATCDEIFYGALGEQIVPFMHIKDGYFQYAEYNGIRALRMKYKNSNMAMDILIPSDKQQQITDLFNDLTLEEKQELYKTLSSSEEIAITTLKLPKFEFSSEAIPLNDYLIPLGMTKAFTAGGDFSPISANVYISKIYHKTYIRVDEDGTKAAAATSVMMDRLSLLGGDNILFEADVPFLYQISDTSDGTTLFLGVLNTIP